MISQQQARDTRDKIIENRLERLRGLKAIYDGQIICKNKPNFDLFPDKAINYCLAENLIRPHYTGSRDCLEHFVLTTKGDRFMEQMYFSISDAIQSKINYDQVPEETKLQMQFDPESAEGKMLDKNLFDKMYYNDIVSNLTHIFEYLERMHD